MLFSTTTGQKSSVCENYNGQLKKILSRILEYHRTNDWQKYLSQAVKIFNNQPSTTLPDGLSPYEAEKPENMGKVQDYHLKKRAKLAKKVLKRYPSPRFHIGDFVRHVLPVNKAKTDGLNKGFKPKFSEAVYQVKYITKTTPRGYYIGVKGDNYLPRFYYAEELRLWGPYARNTRPTVIGIIDHTSKVVSRLRNGKPRTTVTLYKAKIAPIFFDEATGVPRDIGQGLRDHEKSEIKYLNENQLKKYTWGLEALRNYKKSLEDKNKSSVNDSDKK